MNSLVMRGLTLCMMILAITSWVSAADTDIDEYTVADSTGDWGFPSPYSHYIRGPGYIQMSYIFDTLVWKDQDGYLPALAKNWEYLPDQDAYVFNLDENVTWHDGQKFTAQDVVFTFDYIKEHPYMWVNSEPVKEAEAMDDYTVKVYLNHPYAPFLDMIAGTLPILPEHIYEDVDAPDEFTESEALTGTGPYKLSDYNKAQGTYLYEANEDYYQGSPKVKQLRFVKVSNEMAAASLKNGDVDAASVPPETVTGLESSGFEAIESDDDLIYKMMINYNEEPFSDLRFRQALAYAIDRQDLVEKVLRGYGVVASPGLYSADSEWYNPNADLYANDPEKARELLREMGYELDGQFFSKDGKTLEVELLVDISSERAGELIRQQLEEAGIMVDLRSVDSKTLDSLVGEWEFDLALIGHGGMGGDPEILCRIIGDGYGFNSARYHGDERLDELLDLEVTELDPDKRKEIIDEIQVLHAQDLPSLPLYYSRSYFAYDGKVDLFYTKNGISNGIPMAMNKIAFLRG